MDAHSGCIPWWSSTPTIVQNVAPFRDALFRREEQGLPEARDHRGAGHWQGICQAELRRHDVAGSALHMPASGTSMQPFER